MLGEWKLPTVFSDIAGASTRRSVAPGMRGAEVFYTGSHVVGRDTRSGYCDLWHSDAAKHPFGVNEKKTLWNQGLCFAQQDFSLHVALAYLFSENPLRLRLLKKRSRRPFPQGSA
jgi:hypothetical protein